MRTREDPVDFSVIISCYFEEQSIDEFYQRLARTLTDLGRSYELIFVNDGSTDATYAKLVAIFEQDPQVAGVFDLFRNAGQSNAKTPGLLCASGRAIVLIDSDLQLDPEEFPRLVEQFDAGSDIVTGYRRDRRDSWKRRLPSLLANVIMRKAAGAKLRDFGCTFKIYDSRLVSAFEFGRFKPWRPLPVISMAGRIAEVAVNHHPRRYGTSGWTFRKLFEHNMENIVNLSQRPFQLLATVCLVTSLAFMARVLVGQVVSFEVMPRVTNGLILNAIVIGALVTLSVLCVLGEYVVRNFTVLQRRPAFAVRDFRLRGEVDRETLARLGLSASRLGRQQEGGIDDNPGR